MTINTFLHILCILTLAVGAVTLVLTILNKKISLIRKINSSLYLIVLCGYVYVSEFLISFLKSYYYSTYTYNEIFAIVLNIISLVAIFTVLIGTNLKHNEKFEKYIYKSIEFIVLIICVALVWNLFYSNSKNVHLFPILLMSFVLTETYLINSTETLKMKSSIAYYFISNIIFSGFWIVEFILLITSTKISNDLLFLFLFVLIISFSSIILGILSAKKEYKKW